MVGLDHWPQSDGQSESIWGWGASALDPYPLRWHQAVSAWWHRCGTLGPYRLDTLAGREDRALPGRRPAALAAFRDRKSTRLNSSHVAISYAVFCLEKKNGLKSGITF